MACVPPNLCILSTSSNVIVSLSRYPFFQGKLKMSSVGPLVSIVVPCYNQADYLEQAIKSVLSQDYPGIELIVLDDGSTDDTRAVLALYAGKFHYETHANIGQARTLNKGWGMSKGRFLSYLAADDFLLPGAVRTSVEKLIADPKIVLTYCDFN